MPYTRVYAYVDHCGLISIACPLDTAGGYSWSATTANTVVKGHCNYADAHFVKNIASELSRTCDSKGVWSAVDFTGCTVMPGTGPILLIWHLLRTGSIYTVDQRTALLEAAVSHLYNTKCAYTRCMHELDACRVIIYT